MSREDAVDLLDTMEIGAMAAPGRQIKIGTVLTTSVGATVSVCAILFDGETVTGTKQYPCLSSYTPKVGDRVVVLPVGSRTSWLVLGAIGPASGDIRLNGTAGYVAQSPNGTYWKLTPTDSGATSWTVV
jgi:hypothetical protein